MFTASQKTKKKKPENFLFLSVSTLQSSASVFPRGQPEALTMLSCHLWDMHEQPTDIQLI